MRKFIFLLCSVLFSFSNTQTFAAEKVKLEYKFKTGTEWHYTFTSNLNTNNDQGMLIDLDGKNRVVVLEVDAKGAAFLCTRSRIEKKRIETAFSDSGPFTNSAMLAFHSNPQGKHISRRKLGSSINPLIAMQLEGLGEGRLALTELPKKELSTGDVWDSESKFYSFPISVKATLEKIETVNGSRRAVIRSEIISKNGSKFPVSIQIKGKTKLVFDISKGEMISEETELKIGDVNSGLDFKHIIKLQATGKLGNKELPELTTMAKEYEKVISLLFENKFDKAIKNIKELKKQSKDDEWKKDLTSLLTAIDKMEEIPNLAGDEEEEFTESPDVTSLAPSYVTINKKDVKTSDIIKEIEKQTGNKIKMSHNFSDALLPEFNVEKMTFWQAIDLLAEKSGNVYAKEACGGGG